MSEAVAALQMSSGSGLDANLHKAGELLAQAADAGAGLAVLPENFAFMGHSEHDKLALAEAEGAGRIQDFLAAAAARHGIWIVGGTLPLAGPDSSHVWPACLVYDASGRQLARYDKIHLFDVDLPDSGESYRESDTLLAGSRIQVLDTPVGRLGLAVCYDLRFPELFRALVDAGAELVTLPSAFTATTGEAHWEPLLRARAIENQCYMIAAAQCGYHASGRQTWGHSMIVDPWGRVLDEAGREPGPVLATLDRATLGRIRRQFPSLQHRRQWHDGDVVGDVNSPPAERSGSK